MERDIDSKSGGRYRRFGNPTALGERTGMF